MGKWMAEAFAGRDGYALAHTGVSYYERPELHELLYKFGVLRACALGVLQSTPDLKTCCHLYKPGQPDDVPTTDGRALAVWKEFCEKAGGEEAVRARVAKVRLDFE